VARETVEVVLVGLGSIGLKHYNNLVQLGARVVAVADPEYSRLPSEVPERYDDPMEAIAEEADGRAVVIASPTEFHVEQVQAAAAAKAAYVLVEKPPSVTGTEWRLTRGKLGDTRCVVGFNWRFHRGIDETLVQRCKGSKAVYTIVSNDNITTWPNYGPNSFARDARSGGVLLTSLTHSIDLAILTFGPPTALVSALQSDDPSITNADHMAMVRILHASTGASGLLYTAWRPPPATFITIIRETDCMCVGVSDLQYSADRAQMHSRMMDSFLNYARTGREGNLCTAEQAQVVMDVVDAARLSWANRGPVQFGEMPEA